MPTVPQSSLQSLRVLGGELDSIVSATPLGIVIIEGEQALAVFANEQASDLLGRSVIGSTASERRSWLRRPDGSEHELHELPGLRALHGEAVEAEEAAIVLPDARLRTVEIYATPLRARFGGLHRAVLELWDVTRRKRAEEQVLLKLSELEAALAALPDVYFRVDTSGIILQARSGRTASWSVERFIGKPLEEAFARDVLERLRCVMERVRVSGGLGTLEYEWAVGGEARWHEVRVLPLSATELVLIVRDITELKRAEQQNQAKEQRFRAIFDCAFQFIGLLDVQGTLLEVNQTALDFAGMEPQDVLGKPFWLTPWWDVSPEARAELEQAVQRARTGEFVRYRTEIRGKGDQRAVVDFSLKPVRDDQGKVVLLIPEGRDITQLEAARKALEESEERFRAAIEFAPIGVALVGLDGRFLKVNCALCELVGYSEAELLRLTFQEITHPQDVELDLAAAHDLATGKMAHYHREKRYLHKLGHVVWARLSVSLVRAPGGAPRMFVTDLQDTTEQRASEAKLRSSVEEKEVLLREIHHRVKNNLQVISSILRLQGERSESDEVRGMFQDSHARIQTMALIHDQLYKSQNLASIDFSAHLRDLTVMLVRLFGKPICDIRTELQVEPLLLNLDTAIPLGLVANELITNVLKHAFVGRAAGTLSLSLVQREGSYTLRVADDGIGFPPSFSLETSKSLGIRMVRALARQLRGKLSLVQSHGSAVSLTAPIETEGYSTSSTTPTSIPS